MFHKLLRGICLLEEDHILYAKYNEVVVDKEHAFRGMQKALQHN
jgi:hypothetical protein